MESRVGSGYSKERDRLAAAHPSQSALLIADCLTYCLLSAALG